MIQRMNVLCDSVGLNDQVRKWLEWARGWFLKHVTRQVQPYHRRREISTQGCSESIRV